MVYNSFDDFSIMYSTAIIEAVDAILSYEIHDLISIILFGSCARLNIHSGSDIDFLVITESQIKDHMVRGGIKSSLDALSYNIPADILFTTIELFENTVNLRIYDSIKKEGIYLWKEGSYTDVYNKLLCNSKKRLPVFAGY